MNESFGKEYKLCSKKHIEQVFSEGKQIKSFPFVLRYAEIDLAVDVPFQIVISVPKRRFKRAVDRNRIKRLMREVVRKQKSILEAPCREHQKSFALFLIYISKKEESYQMMMRKIETLFQRLIDNEM